MDPIRDYGSTSLSSRPQTVDTLVTLRNLLHAAIDGRVQISDRAANLALLALHDGSRRAP